ncbi:MAG: helix-turn-helix domain-containing protein [Solirubrobacterales bacterium]
MATKTDSAAVDNSTCGVCATADILCSKWTAIIIRDLAAGEARFCELERSLSGISPRTLSLRLRELESNGIVERRTYAEVPPRVEYALTKKGEGLTPIVEAMRAYGNEWLGEICGSNAQKAA